jgi:CRP-like cAMP-binding protein
MPDALIAGGLAGLAALSLPIGAAVAVFFRPSARIVAIVMAFGSGALIHAVVTELAVDPAQELVAVHRFEPLHTWIVLAGGFLAGGLLYVGVNAALERMGSGLHWRHRARRKALEQKRAEAAPILEALAKSRIARSLTPEEAETVLPFVRSEPYQAGEAVFRRGDPSDGLYVVESGTFEIHHDVTTPDGVTTERVTAVEPGATTGGMGMLAGKPRMASLIAGTDGSVLHLSRESIEHLTERLPRIREIVADIVSQELFEAARDSNIQDPEQWSRIAVENIEQVTRAEVEAAERQAGSASPMAIFVGTLQDGIPESIAIGASFVSLAAFAPTFMVAVFLSNLPEAVAGTSALLKAKFTVTRVMLMWLGLMIASGLAGTLGYMALHGASPAFTAFLGAVAGGGVVAMLAMTMMPEAYESGRAGVAPATIIGFLSSLLLAVMELGV